MGLGNHNDGKLNLILSVRPNVSDQQLDQWRASFVNASRILFDATNGQLQLGDLVVCKGSTGSASADAYLFNEVGSCTSPRRRLGRSNTYMSLNKETATDPPNGLMIVHELGHYVFGLGEEYSTNGDQATSCVRGLGPNPGQGIDACIMEARSSDAAIRQFCSTNHETFPDNAVTQQTTLNGGSCWATMTGPRAAGDVTPQLTLTPASRDSASPRWITVTPGQLFALVIDRSGSMAGTKIVEAKRGAKWWVDRLVTVDQIGTRLSVVSFASDRRRDVPFLGINSNNQTPTKNTIDGLQVGGLTAIGDGLQEALNAINDENAAFASPVIVLLTDGRENTGQRSVAQVQGQLSARHVRVFVVGIGPDIEPAALQNLAAATGGQFSRISLALPERERDFQIRLDLHEFSELAAEHGGVITSLRETEFEEGPVLIEVEEGSRLATFLVSWQEPEQTGFLIVTPPSGQFIDSVAPPPGVSVIQGDEPYMGYQVKDPEPGTWQLAVRGDRKARHQLMAFSRNTSINGVLYAAPARYEPGDRVPLFLHAYFDGPLTNLEMSGTAEGPDGKQHLVEFTDDGNGPDETAGDGVYSAIFHSPAVPGTYQFRATVVSDGTAVPIRGCLPPEETFSPSPVPPFRRQFKASVLIGDEPRRTAELDPNLGRPGDQLDLRLKGHLTHFRPDGQTVVDLGVEITVVEVQIDDPENGKVTIAIDSGAGIGPRTLVVTTPSERERVEVEGGFFVDKDGIPDDTPDDRLPDDDSTTSRGPESGTLSGCLPGWIVRILRWVCRRL